MEMSDAIRLLMQLRVQSGELKVQVCHLHDHIGDRLIGLVNEQRVASGRPEQIC